MPNDKYRSKYMTLLDELEEKERSWEEVDQRVRRTLSHLLIIAQGPTTAELSAHLETIRKSLRDGGDLADIEREVEQLKEQVIGEGKWADHKAEEYPPVHEVIIQLIERIPLPRDLSPKAVVIIKELEKGIPPRMVPWAISSVASLMIEMRTRIEGEKQQIENLLKEVTEKIAEMGNGLDVAGQTALGGFEDNRALDRKVTAEVATIRDSADRAEDLDAFRNALTQVLDSIDGHLKSKRESDEKREQALRSEVDKLQGQVDELEGGIRAQKEMLEKARRESYRDPMIGCLNRLAYEERIKVEVSRARRYGNPMSVMMLDLDKFKSINDTFGHLAGDQVLKAIAGIASKQLREVDSFCRYGGEEFVALLPETNIKGAMAAAEKVRAAIEKFHFHHRGEPVGITISAGVAQLGKDEEIGQLMERADKALYQAKSSGRNRCVQAP